MRLVVCMVCGLRYGAESRRHTCPSCEMRKRMHDQWLKDFERREPRQ